MRGTTNERKGRCSRFAPSCRAVASIAATILGTNAAWASPPFTLERELQELRERETQPWWPNRLGGAILVIVSVIPILGLVAAWFEFRAAKRQRSVAAAEQREPRGSTEHAALASSRHGILILSTALAFCVLELRFAFPVSSVGSTPPGI